MVDGKYRIDRVLGMGGMGIVVAGHHIRLDERVAIKFLRDEFMADRDAVKRFAREARTAIKIKSEHAVRVLDVGSLANGTPYMVMEYLEGEDLATTLRKQGPLSVEQAAEFMLQACEAMAEAHALGIVHRDLKPGNLFVTRRADGIAAVKVFDFGISKGAKSGQTASDLTGKAVALGSPSYMSPEQLASAGDLDARADIWALGVTLFEMLTAALPFEAPTTPEICGAILRDPPRAMRDVRAGIPRALEAVVRKCLQKDREQRYQNVAALALALVPFGPARAKSSAQRVWRTIHANTPPTPLLGIGPSTEPPPASNDRASHTRPLGRNIPAAAQRSRFSLVASALAIVALGSGVAWRFSPAWSAAGEPAAASPVEALTPTLPTPALPAPPPPAAEAPAAELPAIVPAPVEPAAASLGTDLGVPAIGRAVATRRGPRPASAAPATKPLPPARPADPPPAPLQAGAVYKERN
jgi:serine/threonine-protein kinase